MTFLIIVLKLKKDNSIFTRIYKLGKSIMFENKKLISLKNYKNITGIGDLIEKFEEVNYSVILKKDGNKVQDSFIEYQYYGQEEIQGIETYRVTFEMTNKIRKYAGSRL